MGAKRTSSCDTAINKSFAPTYREVVLTIEDRIFKEVRKLTINERQPDPQKQADPQDHASATTSLFLQGEHRQAIGRRRVV